MSDHHICNVRLTSRPVRSGYPLTVGGPGLSVVNWRTAALVLEAGPTVSPAGPDLSRQQLLRASDTEPPPSHAQTPRRPVTGCTPDDQGSRSGPDTAPSQLRQRLPTSATPVLKIAMGRELHRGFESHTHRQSAQMLPKLGRCPPTRSAVSRGGTRRGPLRHRSASASGPSSRGSPRLVERASEVGAERVVRDAWEADHLGDPASFSSL